MSWCIIYSEDARKDLENTQNYIRDVLLEPDVAKKQIKRIVDSISSLDHMPLRHRLYEHDPWRTAGLRVLPIDNYLAFYLADETNATVKIVRIIYGGRDIEVQLEQSE